MTSALPELSREDASAVLEAWNELWPPGIDFRSRLARLLRTLTNAATVTINSFDIGTGERSLLVEPPTWAEVIQERRAETNVLLAQHPIANQLLETGSTATLRLSDHVKLSDWQQTELYQRYYQPLGLTWEIVVPIPAAGGKVHMVTINSTHDFADPAKDFTARDVAVCEALVPVASLGFGGLSEGTSDTWTGMAAGWSLIRFDYARKITHVSPPDAAGVLVSGLTLPATVLPSKQQTDSRRTRVRLHDGEWLIQYVGGSASEHIVAAKRLCEAPPDLSSLSRRQLEVLKLITQGYTNEKIGTKLGISAGTVRKHVEMILNLLGASNRAEATAMWYAHNAQIPLHD